MGFFRSPFLYVPLILLLLAVVALKMVTSVLSAVYFGSIIVILAAGLGYETLRRRRLNERIHRSDAESDG